MKVKESAGLAIIFDGKVLLAHTTGRGWWGSYGIPKGGIDEGESKIDAAIRETWEEVGIRVPKKLINKTEHTYTLTSKGQRANKIVYWFIVEIDSLKQLGIKDMKIPRNQLQLEEVDWAGFIPLAEANKRIMKSQINVINNLRGAGLLENDLSTINKYNKLKQNMKYVKLFEEFINEKIDTKYWTDYHEDADKFEMWDKMISTAAVRDRVVNFNNETELDEVDDKGQKKVQKLADEFFKVTGWISDDIIDAMISQEA